jgi:hypothetical protein
MGGVYYILQDSVGFDNLMHGKSPKGNQKQRSLEDFGKFTLSLPIAWHYERPLTVFLQLSLSSACRPSTRSLNKCGVFGVVGIGERSSGCCWTVFSTFFLKLFHVPYFVTWLLGEM